MISINEYINRFKYNPFIDNDMIIEGLNIDEKNKLVKLTSEHNKGVDFDIDKLIHYKVNNINVYSIFKRTKLKTEQGFERDGNPFIYALKEINGWKFDISDQDIINYCRKFLNQCEKIDKQYDTIIIVPSGSNLNERFMKTLSGIIKSKYNIKDFFIKVTKEDAYDSRNLTKIKNDSKTNKEYEDILDEIDDGFKQMKGKWFEAKHINKKYLKYIECIISNNNNYELFDCLEYIMNKNILVLDDTISSGETISKCVKAIQSYDPNKVDVITLLSKIK